MCAFSIHYMLLVSVFILVNSVSSLVNITSNKDAQNIKYASAITISLKNFHLADKSTHIHKEYIIIASPTTTVNVQDIPNTVGFFIIQIHTFGTHALISNDTRFTNQYTVSGTNVGLVQIIETNLLTKSFYIKSTNTTANRALLVLLAYDEESPVPGGCNLSFKTEIAPYQNVSYTENIVKVESQAPAAPGLVCEKLVPQFDIYHMYLNELDLSEATYFEGIERMLTPDDVIANGKKVPISKGNSRLRKYYSAYPGIGVVFGIVTYLGNNSAAYIPIVSYACNVQTLDGCYSPVSLEWKILCAVAFFIGIFLCFLGHYFFKTGLFFIGFLMFSIIAFMLRHIFFGEIEGWYYITAYEVSAFTISAIFGVFWVLIWEKCGKPLITILLNITIIGFFTASTFFYFLLGDYDLFQLDFNFWGVFCSILFITCILFPWSSYANIFVCSCLGSLAILFPVDHYLGSNLRYIIINTVRRATVSHFEEAIIQPPFQWKDLLLTVTWVALTLIGFYVQFLQQRRRAPFPSPLPRQEHPSTERTPLLLPYSTMPSAPPNIYYNDQMAYRT